MSATFKNARKKLSQSDLRKAMQMHKTKNQKSVKINSPLAKYLNNEAGEIMCILCQSIVRSEAVWNVHVNAKQHRQNVEHAKALKEKTKNFTTSIKRPSSPPPLTPSKKVKGILKNSSRSTSVIPVSNIVVIENDQTPTEGESNSTPNELKEQKNELPSDFFDATPSSSKKKKTKNSTIEYESMEVDDPDAETLPEGFFDDPKLDAKARNIEFKDPIEEEWERFQKAIKDADFESAAIIAEDQEEATTERQIDEIEEQMQNWSRVVALDKQKVEIIHHKSESNSQNSEMADDSGDSDIDVDEFLDWRSKHAYH